MKKQGAKDPKDSIGKSRLKNSTGKGEARVYHEFKRKLSRMRAQGKEIQDTLDGKENLDSYDFNWTLPSASEDTFRGLKTHIRHLRRKKAKICEVLESVSQVVSEDKDWILESMEEDDESKTEKFDEGRRGGAEPEMTEADAKRMFYVVASVSYGGRCSRGGYLGKGGCDQGNMEQVESDSWRRRAT